MGRFLNVGSFTVLEQIADTTHVFSVVMYPALPTQCLLAFMSMWYVDYRKLVEPKIYDRDKATVVMGYVCEDICMSIF